MIYRFVAFLHESTLAIAIVQWSIFLSAEVFYMEINSFRYQTVFNIEVYKSLEGGHSFLIGTEIIGDDESFENLSLPT